MDKEILTQLISLNDHLSRIASALENRSFWDSQLFAAIIGAFFAFFVIFVERFFVHRDKKETAKKGLFDWIARNNGFWSPDILLSEANRSGWPPDDPTAPQDVGNKMVTLLRKDVKHWTFPSYRIRRLFKQYETALNKMSNNNSKQEDDSFLAEAKKIHDAIREVAFHATGENDWTAR